MACVSESVREIRWRICANKHTLQCFHHSNDVSIIIGSWLVQKWSELRSSLGHQVTNIFRSHQQASGLWIYSRRQQLAFLCQPANFAPQASGAPHWTTLPTPKTHPPPISVGRTCTCTGYPGRPMRTRCRPLFSTTLYNAP